MRVATIAILAISKLSTVVAEQHDRVEFSTTPHRKRSQGNGRKSQYQQRGERDERMLQERATDEEWAQWLGVSDVDTAETKQADDDEGSMSMSTEEEEDKPITSILDTLTNNGLPLQEEEKEQITSILDTLTNNGLPLEPGPIIEPPVACTLELFVCPDGSTVGRQGPDCEFPNCPTTTSTPSEQVDGQCSCSPIEYNFILNLDSSCDIDELDGNNGIGLTFCFLGVTSNLSPNDGTVRLDDNRNDEEVRRLGGTKKKNDQQQGQRGLSTIVKEQKIIFEDTGTPLTQSEQQQMRFLAEEIEIISIQFLEFDTSGELIVINQDDSYSNVTLQNGSEVTFKSISNNLDVSLAIEDQLDFLPGGVQVTLRGRVTDDVTGDSRIVSNRITWSYTNACDVEPLGSDESIGWITTGELTPASPDFCPAAIPPPETTEAPPTTTEEPSCDLGTIVDVAIGNGSFNTLVAAVTAAELGGTLSSDGPFTVFAPTDDAFAALPEGTVEGLLEDIPALTSILTYHVVAGKVESTDLVNGPVTTVNGADVDINLDDGVKVIDSNVIIPDVQACNGVIHVIDAVLIPPEEETPPATTEAPLPPATTNGPMFSKSSKSKSGKAKTKKPHPMAKTEKQSDAMAKVSTKGDVDSKSGKAKVDKDAKANKGCGTTKSGKGGKSHSTTPSGKGGKSGCGKSGKSGSHSMPYTSKATRLFHKANKMSLSMP